MHLSFNKSDIAIGSLGTYRINIDVTTPLKIIEYCARGIPFIFVGKNNLLTENKPFFLEVPNNDIPLDIVEIIKFSRCVKTIPNLQLEIREFAKKNMGWENELTKLLENC